MYQLSCTTQGCVCVCWGWGGGGVRWETIAYVKQDTAVCTCMEYERPVPPFRMNAYLIISTVLQNQYYY